MADDDDRQIRDSPKLLPVEEGRKCPVRGKSSLFSIGSDLMECSGSSRMEVRSISLVLGSTAIRAPAVVLMKVSYGCSSPSSLSAKAVLEDSDRLGQSIGSSSMEFGSSPLQSGSSSICL